MSIVLVHSKVSLLLWDLKRSPKYIKNQSTDKDQEEWICHREEDTRDPCDMNDPVDYIHVKSIKVHERGWNYFGWLFIWCHRFWDLIFTIPVSPAIFYWPSWAVTSQYFHHLFDRCNLVMIYI